MVQSILDQMQVVTQSASQKELAEKLGISESTISTWKKRGEIPPRQLQKFARIARDSDCNLQIDNDAIPWSPKKGSEIIYAELGTNPEDLLLREEWGRLSRDQKLDAIKWLRKLPEEK